ncbi:MAG: DUF4783 domain-containing protein [Cyclobacteriaceae bacterium]|nr:DUF4783 domain-containing protein [Cyclobacteriaceae bacterium]
MKRFVLVFVFWAGLAVHGMAQPEIFNPAKEAIKKGDATALVKTFAVSVDINLEGNISTYSKAQSEFVLKEFFKKHPVTDFAIMHTGSSKGGLQFAVGRYLTAGEVYTVLIRVRQVGEPYLVHEISFVKE